MGPSIYTLASPSIQQRVKQKKSTTFDVLCMYADVRVGLARRDLRILSCFLINWQIEKYKRTSIHDASSQTIASILHEEIFLLVELGPLIEFGPDPSMLS
jgi:hypothetical protein